MIIYRRTHRARIQCDGKGQNTNHARTLAPYRSGFFEAQRLRPGRVGHAFKKYFVIAYVLIEVSFLALEVTKCPFNNVFSIWIANGVDYDLRG